MSVQVFLQGKLLGVESFLLAGSTEESVVGRSQWVTLLSEVLPRALLAEQGLAKILLGASGAGGFLMVIPIETLPVAEEFLRTAGAAMAELSGHRIRLVWASTENLGDWGIVRKRLTEAMWTRVNTDPGGLDAQPESAGDDEYFTATVAPKARAAQTIGWSPETPAHIVFGEAKHSWAVGSGPDAIPIARHSAPGADGATPATAAQLAAQSQGRPVWGVLRGDVDNFGLRLRKLDSIDQHIQVSVLFKQFFAGELEVACSLPDYWSKVSILYSGGDDFAVYGSWDALVLLAREIRRLFEMFCEANLKELEGPEAKTITMALALAPSEAEDGQSRFAYVYEEAGRALEAAKSSDKDCINIFGKTVEWRHLNHASDLKEIMVRMVREFGCPPQFLEELSSFYHEKPASSTRPDRIWRYHRRLTLAIGAKHQEKELQRLQKALITDMVGRSATQVKVRPAGRVAVEWTRLLIES